MIKKIFTTNDLRTKTHYKQDLRISTFMKESMSLRRLLISLLVMLAFSFDAYSQIYSYKYLYSVKDGRKVKADFYSEFDYFVFTNDMTMCYESKKDGISKFSSDDGTGVYKYITTENDIHIYLECYKKGSNSYMKRDSSVLYFSNDYQRLNWRDTFDDMLDNAIWHGSLRVFEYVSDPNKDVLPTTPKSLY